MYWGVKSCLMPRLTLLVLIACLCPVRLSAQTLEIHGFVTQGFVYSSHNNYLTMQTSNGSLQWTDGAISVSDSLTDKLRVGIQLRMYQLGQLGGPNLQIDWASGDYRVNDYFGIRAGKVKTVTGLFNDSQDVDAVYLWTLLPQCSYPIDNESFFLSHLGGEVYGDIPLGSRAGKLRYSGYAGQVTLDLNGGYIQQFADEGLVFTNPPSGKTFGGDLRWETPLKGLTIGASVNSEALDGTAPTGNLHVPRLLIDVQYAQYQRGKFYFATEYDRTPFNPTITFGSQVIPAPEDLRSWYAMASYHLLKKFQAGSYYSHWIDKSADPASPASYSKDWVISGRYDFNAYFYGKLEEHFLHGTGLGYYESTNPDGLKTNSNLLAAKIGFTF
jgi:hypothetical protein